jgi:hypothetical protein
MRANINIWLQYYSREEMMKMISALMSMLMSMLLPLPVQAKDVYMALLSEDITNSAKNFDSLDAVIMANTKAIDQYFQNGDLTLQSDQELVIRGGRGSIATALDRYKSRSVILSGRGVLASYGCYYKRPIGRENTTYVILRDIGPGGNCNKALFTHATRTIDLKSLSAAVKAMPAN